MDKVPILDLNLKQANKLLYFRATHKNLFKSIFSEISSLLEHTVCLFDEKFVCLLFVCLYLLVDKVKINVNDVESLKFKTSVITCQNLVSII